MQFSNKVYDVVKALAQVILPAFGTLYSGLAVIWGMPYAEKVVASIVALDTFLGVLLAISSASYKPRVDGHVVVDTSNPAQKVLKRVSLDVDGEDLVPGNTFNLAIKEDAPAEPENKSAMTE